MNLISVDNTSNRLPQLTLKFVFVFLSVFSRSLVVLYTYCLKKRKIPFWSMISIVLSAVISFFFFRFFFGSLFEEVKDLTNDCEMTYVFLFLIHREQRRRGQGRDEQYLNLPILEESVISMWTSVFQRCLIGTTHFCRLRMASTSAPVQAKLYVLQYVYVENALEKRQPHRQAHLALINKEAEKGNVVLAGAVDNPPNGGLLILRNLTAEAIEQLVRQDPYVINGVVKYYSIKPYMAVVGDALLHNDLIKI